MFRYNILFLGVCNLDVFLKFSIYIKEKQHKSFKTQMLFIYYLLK